ncbi:MAG: DUF4396 domain-containing protein [Bacteroidetes bacterium]|nr:DUF4396 domain-containing protein [Bacteroidota bacterium]
MAAICGVIVLVDILNGNKQKMPVMNIVWPVTALYAGPLGLLSYYAIGRKSSRYGGDKQKPFWQSAVVGTLHCGAGCTLGDICAEGLTNITPITIVANKLYNGWILDFILAFLIGIIFQYYAIKPMRNLSVKEGIVAALKADSLSLTFWQIGMYGWMAICRFLIFNHPLDKGAPVFWFMMQIAMLFGFVTAYGINWYLLKKGIKEEM